MSIRHYLSIEGHDPFQRWLDGLKDLQGRVAIQRRIDRLEAGNFGDHKFCKDGVWELRIDIGPRYRVYYAEYEKSIVLVLRGGSKRRQAADINDAVKYWADFKKRQS